METTMKKSAITVGLMSTDAVAAQRVMSLIEEQLQEAQRDLMEKGECLRWTVMRSNRDHHASDRAYEAWQQAKAKATSIYAEVKAHRESLAA